MPRKSLRWFAKPDFEAEVRHALGRQPDDIGAALGEIFSRAEPVPSGLRRALSFVLTGKDNRFSIHITRRSAGRPSGSKKIDASAEAVTAFVQERIQSGQVLKAAVEDAGKHFKVGRSTIFARLKEAREQDGKTTGRLKIAQAAAKEPGTPYIDRGKRSQRRQKRKRMTKQWRSWRHVKLIWRDVERAMRMGKRSKKQRDNSD